jgi:hypothetical protein
MQPHQASLLGDNAPGGRARNHVLRRRDRANRQKRLSSLGTVRAGHGKAASSGGLGIDMTAEGERIWVSHVFYAECEASRLPHLLDVFPVRRDDGVAPAQRAFDHGHIHDVVMT